MKVVVIGAVAAGPKVASRIMRLRPDAQVTVLERNEHISFAGCGLPYYVSGAVKEQKDLMSTPAGVKRDPTFFEKVKNVRVLTRTEAVHVDRQTKRVRVRNLQTGAESDLEYDYLVFATGASPIRPPLPGLDLANVFTLHSIPDADAVRQRVDSGMVHHAVVIGGGLIGVETAESLRERGCHVTLVEMMDQILWPLDWEMAKLVEQHMAANGVDVLTSTKVLAFHGAQGAVTRVETTSGDIPADLVVLGVGVKPNVELAVNAGLELGRTGAIRVDSHLRTSDPAIYALGDCAETVHLVTGEPCYAPLGSTANKQGRVAANNICGIEDVFPGVLGSTVCRVFQFTVARTGLTEKAARAAGYEVISVLVPGPDKPHYMPGANPIILKLVVDVKTRRLIGAQGVGMGEADKRIDAAAVAITAGMTVDQVAKLDLCYAPPFSPAMDNLITAADVARNKLDGRVPFVSPMEVHAKLQKGEDIVLLDVRSPAEYETVRLPNSTLIPLGALRGRVNELPRDKEIIAFCAVSLRGYEAALILKAAGLERVRVLDGGVAAWPYEKVMGKK
ncbi:MAG TPA: FAD-dependent oxidoreductase [Candidatus Hydrogenedentes bacterium]|nr:FAD-dependent oxidoreductase [Candidatus Hydrogenedentota bacterium]HOL76428.1 FAD-dependent oxidoreductase [Candidatus Hydrogenedentota bacterium]HPO85466.1 FAD-dependent oxidoreductase [Candidatus Hydrogenedentota bacterium]